MAIIADEYKDRIDALWTYFLSTRREDLKDDLVEAYAPLVHVIAKQVEGGLPKHIEHDDLFMSGIFGLAEAIDRFDPTKGVKFQNFAHFRIRGAMVDELRVLDWVPRLIRIRSKTLASVREDFIARHHKEPTNEQLAELMDLSVEKLQEVITQARESEWLRSLDEPVAAGEEDDSFDLNSQIANGPVELEEQIVVSEELDSVRARLASRMTELSERDQLTLIFYYLYDMTLSEVGELMGVSESRICQIQTKALGVVRDALQPTYKEPM